MSAYQSVVTVLMAVYTVLLCFYILLFLIIMPCCVLCLHSQPQRLEPGVAP